MNLDTALAAHAEWKVKLRVAISNKATLDAATIGMDNCCPLGTWLYGEAKRAHGALPQYGALVAKHRAFHAEAGKVAQLINAQKFTDAERALEAATPYAAASQAVGLAVVAMKQHLGKR